MSQEAITLQERLRDLKAAAYDTIAAIEHNQRELSKINSEMKKVDDALRAVKEKDLIIVPDAKPNNKKNKGDQTIQP